MEFKSGSPFISADGDDETHAAARVEASSVLLIPRLFRLENGRRSRFAFCCTSQMPAVANEQEKSLATFFHSSSIRLLACMA